MYGERVLHNYFRLSLEFMSLRKEGGAEGLRMSLLGLLLVILRITSLVFHMPRKQCPMHCHQEVT